MASSGRKGKKTEKRQDKMAVAEENVLFQSAIKKFKDQDTQNYTCALEGRGNRGVEKTT